MAAPYPVDKVRDKEYTNWLKVTLALYYMKSGLHTFIQSEVDCLHQTLVQKICGGQTVPLPPCTTCHASLVKRNKSGVWAFQKQCKSYCDVWLYELLKLHANPKSDKIYWANSDIPSWPFSPWECVKVFMPRGQQASNTGPAKCDAQALLTLLASCTHFHLKLSSQGLGLTQTISTVRNKVMHDGEMKVSDADTRNYLQQIIQLLEDPISLKSLEDCKAAVCNIHKIHNDSVDVFLNVDQKMIALKTAVNELRQEFGMQEKRTLDTVESLKEEYSQLREQLTKKMADVEARVDSIEQDVQLVKEQTDTSLQKQEKKHQEMLTTVTSQLTKRYDDAEAKVDSIKQDVQSVKEQTDTVLQKQETSLENMSASVATCQIRIGTVEENVQTFSTKLQEFETGKEEANSALQEQKKFSESMSTSVATHEVRLVAVEENLIKLNEMGLRTEQNNSCAKGTSRKRRPESGGLRQLKNQTEDKLDSLRKLGLISTKQMEEANKMLQDKKSVVIKGNPGEGKTTTALHLIDNEKYIDRRVVFSDPGDWRTVDTDWVDIVVLDDIFGQSDFDPSRLKKWQDYLPTIQEHVDAGKLQVIITTRVDILAKAYTHLGSINLFYDEFSFTLSSDKLQESEKMNILNKELHRYKKVMHDDDKKECIANFKGMIGFPQCCSYFAGDNGLFAQGLYFFRQPEKLFTANISRLEDHRFLSLAFLFCTGDIDEKYLSPEAMTEWGKSVLIELSSHLGIKKKKASVTLLRESYGHFSGLYVKKYQSSIKFSHNTVYEAVGLILGQRSPEMVVKYCDSLYLNQRTYAAESKDETSHNVFIPAFAYGHLAERIILEVLQGNITFTHSALKEHQFVTELKNHLSKCNRINDFLFCEKSYMLLQKVSDGNCQTFLQNLLQGDENTANLVYDQFLEFLICSHDRFDNECMKCSEKKCLLELALYYNHLYIADKLIARNACISPISLCNAVRHGNLNRVKTILDSLKRDGILDPQNIYLRTSLCRAFMSGNPSLVELLLKEGIQLDNGHVTCFVQQGDIDVLVKLVEHLKHCNGWDPLHEKGNQEDLWKKSWISGICPSLQKELQFSRALCFAYREEKLDMVEFLLTEGVKVTMDIFLAVLGIGSYATVTQVLQDLKDTNQWNPESDCVSKAGEFAYQKFDLFELLLQKEVSFTMKTLPGVVSWGTNESITKVLQHLKHGFKWDPKSEYASQALKNALIKEMSDVCVLLVKEGVMVTMNIITDNTCWGTKESLAKVIEHLRELSKWDPKSDIALETLKRSFIRENNEMSEQLLLEGVTLTMSDLSDILYNGSRDSIIKAVHHLKDNGKWDIKVLYSSEALITLIHYQKYDACDILMHEGVIIDMDDLQGVVNSSSINFVQKAVQQLKDTGSWDAKCSHASKALTKAYRRQKFDVCDLLIHEGVSLSTRDLSDIMQGSEVLVESIKRAIRHLKDSNNWDPKCEHLSTKLEQAYRFEKYTLCNLLVQEGVSLSMNILPSLIDKLEGPTIFSSSLPTSVNSVTRAIQHLKDTDTWNPSSEFARQALEKAFSLQNHAVFILLVQEKISPTMKILPDYADKDSGETFPALVQLMKMANTWDPSSHWASDALELAFRKQKYDICNLLIHEKVSLTMKILPGVVCSGSIEPVTKVIQRLKDENLWDPSSYDASLALRAAYEEVDSDGKHKCDVTDLLFQEGVRLEMKDLGIYLSDESLAKVIHHLKNKGDWDPHFEGSSFFLQYAYVRESYDVCDLLIQEGLSLTMDNLLHLINHSCPSLKSVSKVVQHLKDKGNWNPHCESASDALQRAYVNEMYDVCDLLVQEGISPTMENLLLVIKASLKSCKSVSKVVQHLKDIGNWNPHCESAYVALQRAYTYPMLDISDLLIQEGVPPTMANLPLVISNFCLSMRSVSKVVKHLKDKGNWDPHCESASVALQKAYRCETYHICDQLIQEGILPTMENLFHIINVSSPSMQSVSTVVQHLKDSGNWNPKCESASAALQQAYTCGMNNVCDLLIQEGISSTVDLHI